TDELADHGVPAGRRRTALREYLEAMRALWTEEEAAYDGEFVKFGPSWAWPKPVQSHIPVLVGAAGTEKNFKWIARSADGWITTPRDFDIDEPVRLLADVWADAGREGAPQIVALDFKPVPEKLARWAELGVTEVLFGLPDRSEDEVAAGDRVGQEGAAVGFQASEDDAGAAASVVAHRVGLDPGEPVGVFGDGSLRPAGDLVLQLAAAVGGPISRRRRVHADRVFRQDPAVGAHEPELPRGASHRCHGFGDRVHRVVI